MGESFGNLLTIVEVTPDAAGSERKQFWVAAAKESQAITLVLAAVPEGWTADLVTGISDEQQTALGGLHLKPGEVYRLTSDKRLP